jgi:hypothetical protein
VRAQKAHRLRVVDLIFLGLFACAGAWAFWVAYQVLFDGKDVDSFICACTIIVVLGFLFGIVNFFASHTYDAPDGEWPRPFWRLWVALDGIQFLVAWWIAERVPDLKDTASVNWMAKVLAATFIVFLLLDLGAMIRAIQLKWK